LNLEEAYFYFQYLPQELENASITGFYNIQEYIGKPLYFVNDNQASYEILRNLEPYILRYQKACLNNSEDCEEELPVKDCNNNIIVFSSEESEFEAKVWREKNCVYISGNFIKGADGFLYKMLKII
jgi:hypothetical protein